MTKPVQLWRWVGECCWFKGKTLCLITYTTYNPKLELLWFYATIYLYKEDALFLFQDHSSLDETVSLCDCRKALVSSLLRFVRMLWTLKRLETLQALYYLVLDGYFSPLENWWDTLTRDLSVLIWLISLFILLLNIIERKSPVRLRSKDELVNLLCRSIRLTLHLISELTLDRMPWRRIPFISVTGRILSLLTE